MEDNSDRIIKWLREEGITPRPVSDQKCDFSYAVDRLFGALLTVAIAKPKNGNMVILQSQFMLPLKSNNLKLGNYDENLVNLQKELLYFDISDFKISENTHGIDKINLMCYIYPDDLTKQFLFDSLRKLKRVCAFLELYFSS